jgi:predicted RND superfamily exporter protein
MKGSSKYRNLSIFALIAVVAISGLCAYYISKVEFDYDFEKFFPEGDLETEFFSEHRKRFETDNDFILVGIRNEEGIFQEDFLANVKAFSDSLRATLNIIDVWGPTDVFEVIRDPVFGTTFERQHLRWDEPENYLKDSTRIYKTKELIGNYFSEDGKSVAIFGKTVEMLPKAACDTLAADMKQLVAQFDFAQVHVTGRSVGQSYYVDVMQKELGVFVLTSFILVVAFLIIAFRSIWGVLVPILVVVLTVVWILGFMTMTGKHIDVMLTVLPTIMFVVGMSDVVHILSKYLEELRNGATKVDAIKVTFKEVGLATLLTSITTAVGFLTLLTSTVKPMQDFGMYTAIGVFLAYILAFSLLPALMYLSEKPKIAAIGKDKKLYWNRKLRRSLLWVFRHQKLILGVAALVIAGSIYGISRVELNNFLLDDLDESHQLKQDFLFFDKEFSGVRPFEMSLELRDTSKSVFDQDILLKTDSIEAFVYANYGIQYLFSPVAVMKTLNKSMREGSIAAYEIPPTNKAFKKLKKALKLIRKTPVVSMAAVSNNRVQRLSGKVADIGSAKMRKLDAGLDSFMLVNNYGATFDYKLTGTARLIDINNKYLAANMLQGLLIAFLVIALIMGLLYRSLKIILISLVPNMLPLLIVGGMMGYAGIDLKVSTSIIFTIIFGIAVDDTIHFMSKLRLELGKGKSMLYAVKRTYLSTGKAIVITTLILCGGFLTLIMSDFQGTFYIGLMISVALFFAVIADLTLLPILLLVFYKDKKKEKKGKKLPKD